MYNRNRSPHNLSNDSWNSVAKYLATSSLPKRRYLKDLKPFNSVLTVSNVGLQTGKAALMAVNMLMMEHNKHDIQQSMNPDKKLPDFDWQVAVNKHLQTFQTYAIRFNSTAVIKKLLEELVKMKLSARLVDKLTKDVYQSLKRKVAKFGHSVACQKIFFTSLHGSMLFNAANFIFDVVQAGCAHFQALYASSSSSSAVVVKQGSIQPVKAFAFVINRFTNYGVMTIATAVGYAGGSFCNEAYGGFIGSFFAEVFAGVILAGLI